MLRHCNLPLNIFTDFRGHNMAKYTKQQAISIITGCAVKYKENLDGYQLLFILKDKHKHIFSLEVSFNPYNFLHLTGIKLADKTTATDFYERCLNHKLSPDDFSFAPDGTTQLKLEILPQLMVKNISAKMVGDFNGCNPKLYTEKLAGGVLNIDIRTATRLPLQVIATYRRKRSDSVYSELVYKAKKIDWDSVTFPKEYDYLPKPE